jgi:hypothetical protein
LSYDLQIFFPHDAFPVQAWYELLGTFRSGSCEVSFDDQEPTENDAPRDCSIVVDQSVPGYAEFLKQLTTGSSIRVVHDGRVVASSPSRWSMSARQPDTPETINTASSILRRD